MSQTGVKPEQLDIEDQALEQERDDTLTTGDGSVDEGVDTDTDDGDEGTDDSDAGAPDSEVEDDAGTGGDGRRAAPVREPSRREREIARLRQRTQAAEEKAAAAERTAAEVRAQINGRQTQEQQALERERIALMSPDEKLDYFRQQDRQELDRRFAQLNLQTFEMGDRARFEAMCARNPAYQSVAEEVEQQVQVIRQQGGNLPREALAAYVIGKRALDRAGRAKPRQARAGAERLAREQVRAPGGGGSNVRGGEQRSTGSAARLKRIENLEI